MIDEVKEVQLFDLKKQNYEYSKNNSIWHTDGMRFTFISARCGG